MKNKELHIQSAIIQFLRMHNILCYSIPNGTYIQNIKTRTLMKRSGILSGVSDIHIILPKRIIFVEVKTPTGTQQASQKDFQKKVQAMGWEYYIWRDVQDAVKFVESLK